MERRRSGPDAQDSGMGALNGIRIVEFASLGPGPFCAMMLADHGAEVIRIDRVGATQDKRLPVLRSRTGMTLDLKAPEARAVIMKLVETADGIIEGYRPGVMERLGYGPDVLLARNPALVYGRMTGWGQNGPYAAAAGHDINYIALSGALHQCGRAGEKPTPPVNFLGDYGGGGMMLAFGMLAALLAVKNGARGQVIDCAMTDGSALLTALSWGFRAIGHWEDRAGVNSLDTGAPFYDTYETSDGKYIAIGPLEPQFYKLLLEKLGLVDDPLMQEQRQAARWPEQKARLTEIFKSRPRDEWDALLAMTDVCYAPVLSMAEAPAHPHNVARETFITLDDVVQPGPAPALLGTPAARPRPFSDPAADTDRLLVSLGYGAEEIADFRAKGAIG
jgi:alpha-methylacyl-CoA racemase